MNKVPWQDLNIGDLIIYNNRVCTVFNKETSDYEGVFAICVDTDLNWVKGIFFNKVHEKHVPLYEVVYK